MLLWPPLCGAHESSSGGLVGFWVPCDSRADSGHAIPGRLGRQPAARPALRRHDARRDLVGVAAQRVIPSRRAPGDVDSAVAAPSPLTRSSCSPERESSAWPASHPGRWRRYRFSGISALAHEERRTHRTPLHADEGSNDLPVCPKKLCGGESGIRTHGRVSPTHAFQACAFSRSAISPCLLQSTTCGLASAPTPRIVSDL